MILRPRTLAYAGSVARLSGSLIALAVLIVAVAEGLNAAVCCWQSEREA